jgi:hypothetical protein
LPPILLRPPASLARREWAEAAKKIAEAGDDVLVMGEFDNLRPTVQFPQRPFVVCAATPMSAKEGKPMDWTTLMRDSLKWVQPNGFKMNYELTAGDRVISRLRFRSSFGSLATAENADGCWTFKRQGFCQTRATIRACNSETEIAAFRNNTWSGGGTLEFPDGRKFLATTNFWQTKLEFQDVSGEPLIRYKNEGILHTIGGLQIEPRAVNMPETSWMIIFGWYVAIMMQMDSVAAASGGAS